MEFGNQLMMLKLIPRVQLNKLSQIGTTWLQLKSLSPLEVVERVTMDFALRALPRERWTACLYIDTEDILTIKEHMKMY